MSSRNTYHAQVSSFSVDSETDQDLVNLSGVIDSDGDLVTDSMCLTHGAWSSGLESGENISFTAKLKSKVERQEIDGKWLVVRAAYLHKPRLIKS